MVKVLRVDIVEAGRTKCNTRETFFRCIGLTNKVQNNKTGLDKNYMA